MWKLKKFLHLLLWCINWQISIIRSERYTAPVPSFRNSRRLVEQEAKTFLTEFNHTHRRGLNSNELARSDHWISGRKRSLAASCYGDYTPRGLCLTCHISNVGARTISETSEPYPATARVMAWGDLTECTTKQFRTSRNFRALTADYSWRIFTTVVRVLWFSQRFGWGFRHSEVRRCVNWRFHSDVSK